MELAERKGAELAEKAAGLREEFDRWLEVSAPGGQLERHCTQVRAITHVLLLHLDSLDASGPGGDGDGDGEEAVLTRASKRERELLALHRIWGFFRTKLALRFVPWFAEYLAVADELAWSCYEPAQRCIAADLAKEPPLVYLNGGSSPLTLPRGSGWRPEEGPGEVALEGPLQSLPISVIGVPWFHVRHLPDALVIGHEVGHDVERDLGLGATLGSLVAAGLAAGRASADRRAAWQSWCGEVFADVYGTLAGGPGYVGALIDFIGAPRRRVAGEWRGNGVWGSYPTRTLRVLLCTRVLDRLGLGAPADAVRRSWSAAYPSHAMEDYEADVPHVVDALLDGCWPTLGRARLGDLVTFTAEMQQAVEEGAGSLLKGQLPKTSDVRSTLAAARWAYERDAARYARVQAARWTVRRVEELKQAGPRSSGLTAPPEGDLHERDRRAALALAGSLAGASDPDRGGDEDE